MLLFMFMLLTWAANGMETHDRKCEIYDRNDETVNRDGEIEHNHIPIEFNPNGNSYCDVMRQTKIHNIVYTYGSVTMIVDIYDTMKKTHTKTEHCNCQIRDEKLIIHMLNLRVGTKKHTQRKYLSLIKDKYMGVPSNGYFKYTFSWFEEVYVWFETLESVERLRHVIYRSLQYKRMWHLRKFEYQLSWLKLTLKILQARECIQDFFDWVEYASYALMENMRLMTGHALQMEKLTKRVNNINTENS